jgi:hypothetical protein
MDNESWKLAEWVSMYNLCDFSGIRTFYEKEENRMYLTRKNELGRWISLKDMMICKCLVKYKKLTRDVPSDYSRVGSSPSQDSD